MPTPGPVRVERPTGGGLYGNQGGFSMAGAGETVLYLYGLKQQQTGDTSGLDIKHCPPARGR